MSKKYKYIDKECLRVINHKTLHVLQYNRAIREDVIDALPDDKLFPITFSMLHEHKAGVACEPHVRCVILTPATEAEGRKQLILDMEMNIFDILPEIEIPDQPVEPVAEPVA
jgi:hypothetical protein